MCFISVLGVLNALSEYTYFCISRHITSYAFLLVFIIVESLQYILREKISKNSIGLNKLSGNFSSLYLYFLPDFSKHLLSNYFSLKFEDIKDCLWVLNFQILFMLINPRTSFIFVGPMFWIRKVFSCLYRIEEIIPYFCSYVGDNFYV